MMEPQEVAVVSEDGLVQTRKRRQSEGRVSPHRSSEESATEDNGPPASKRLLTGNGNNSDDISSSSELEDECSYSEDPRNTLRNNKWAVNHFTRWQEEHNEKFAGDPENQIPADILKNTDPNLLTKWLSLYAEEARRQDGKLFPANSVYMLLAGIARHMRAITPGFPNILNATNLHYKPLHDSLESTFRKRKEIDALSENKPAEPLSVEEEERLWSSGALSTDTPKGLLRAVYFLNAKHFGVFGGNKHRLMKLSQLKRIVNPPRYIYTYTETSNTNSTEKGFSNWGKKRQASVSLKQAIKNPRGTSTIVVDAAPEKGNRCHVYVLDCYMRKIPPEAFDNDTFYLQPLQWIVDPSRHWYSLQPSGKNTLARMVRDMCVDAGIVGSKTLRYTFRNQNNVRKFQDAESVAMSSAPGPSSLPSPQIVVPPLAFLMQGPIPTQQPLISPPNSTTQSLLLVHSQVQGMDNLQTAPHLVSTAVQPIAPKPVISQSSAIVASNSQLTEQPHHNTTLQQKQTFIYSQTPRPTVNHIPSATNQTPQTSTSNSVPQNQSKRQSSVQHRTPPQNLQSSVTQQQQQQQKQEEATNQQNNASKPSTPSWQSTTPQSPLDSDATVPPMQPIFLSSGGSSNQPHAVPQQLTFTNCHVTIYVTPYPPPSTNA